MRSSTRRSGGRISAGTGDSSSLSPIEVALTSTFVLASSASMMDSCQGIARRSMCAALRLKCLTRDSARCRWRLNTTTRWKPSRIRPWTTARDPPPAPSTTAWRGIFWRPTSLSRAILEARHVRVVPDELLALLGDGVDRAGRVGLLGELVHQGDDPLLVGDRDVGAQEVLAAELGDRLRERHRGAVPQLVGRVDAQVVEGRLLHGSGERMGHRVADEDDALRHARTPSSSRKKPGYEIAADPARSMTVSPSAMRPATAKVIASR